MRNAQRYQLLSRPGGGSGNGHRIDCQLPVSGNRQSGKPGGLLSQQGSRLRAPDLRIRTHEYRRPVRPMFAADKAKSPLAWRRTAASADCSLPIRPHSREAGFFTAWDCKVTPARCSCQEGNTIGCIPSNDGLDTAFGPRFPHRGPDGIVCVGSVCWRLRSR